MSEDQPDWSGMTTRAITSADHEAMAATTPTLADQVAAIAAIEVAARIVARGSRAAIGASTVEILALAHRVIHLNTLADLTFDMLTTADAAQDEKKPDQQRRLRHAVRLKISDVGAALEALGYRQEQQPASKEEKIDGQG